MSGGKLYVKVSPFGILDLLAFKGLTKRRARNFERASAKPVAAFPAVNALAAILHPNGQRLRVEKVSLEAGSARTYRLVPAGEGGRLAPFRPGQYLSVSLEIGGSTITRPYSLSSSPEEAQAGFYELTIKQKSGGFATEHIWESWKVGTEVVCSGPEGVFYHEPLRDARRIVGIAGGCGVTPFRSMAKSILAGGMDAELVLIYGCETQKDMMFREEFARMEAESGGRFKVVAVIAQESVDGCEKGFVTADLVRKHLGAGGSSLFVCGPQAMYDYLDRELAPLTLAPKAVRRESYGEPRAPETMPGYPEKAGGRTFELTVRMAGESRKIPAASNETLLVAMERAGMAPPARCRSGTCGFCRSALVRGEVFVAPREDGRRMADRVLGFIHPCSTFPAGDLELVVPRSP